MSEPSKTNPSDEDLLRPHTFDGIQEYDKRLPNWWLFTLYGAIAFAFVYWFYYHQSSIGMSDQQVLAREMDALEAARMASSLGTLDDSQIWTMSRNQGIVSAGKLTFNSNCAACHLVSLRGKDENPAAVGPNLIDNVWIHGGRPTEIRNTVTKGFLEKGMPTWGPMLGDKKVVEVVAYVLSHHEPPPPASVATATTPTP